MVVIHASDGRFPYMEILEFSPMRLHTFLVSCFCSSTHFVCLTGILIDAMKHGYWIILDELNLAPSDVLEALNRLLDDNRELFIAETQTTVKAHPRFLLFATQNPPGLYGGRKVGLCNYRQITTFLRGHTLQGKLNRLISCVA